MKSRLTACLAILILWSCFGDVLLAVPIQWRIDQGGNDHLYDLVLPPSGMSWSDARAEAETTIVQGQRGYLVTVTTPEEDDFLRVAFQQMIHDFSGYAWIGLTDMVIEANFRWVSGEPFAFSNWLPGEPNNLFDEDYVHYFAGDPGGSLEWGWNDSRNAYGSAYIVEFDAPVAAIPEPCMLTLFGLGIVGLLGCGCLYKKQG